MQPSELNELMFLAYTMPVRYYKDKDIYYLRKGLFNTSNPPVLYPTRTYCLHPQYVRCAICGTYWHNSMGIQDMLIVGCRKCELRSTQDFTHIANSHVRVLNCRAHMLSREDMLSLNKLARTILADKHIEGRPYEQQ